MVGKSVLFHLIIKIINFITKFITFITSKHHRPLKSAISAQVNIYTKMNKKMAFLA